MPSIVQKLLALIILIFISPIFIIASIAILIDDGFPIFFNQKRTAQGKKMFKMFKFRTMIKNSEEVLKNDKKLYKIFIENDYKKAEEILDLAMTKMPIEDFGFYTLLIPFINSYYTIDKKDKAREIFEKIAIKYKENLEYYSSISDSNKNKYAELIYTDIERYRSLVDVLISYEEGEYLESKMKEFNDYLDLFL